MGTKQIRHSMPDLVNENIVFFRKHEDGYFERVEQVMIRDTRTNKLESNSETVSDEKYEITSDDDYDHEVAYQDIDGKEKSIRYKKIRE